MTSPTGNRRSSRGVSEQETVTLTFILNLCFIDSYLRELPSHIAPSVIARF